MTVNVLIPDDLHQQLRERAAKSHCTVDEFAVRLMRTAIGVQLEDHPIRQEGRFAYFYLPKDAPPLDLDRIEAAMRLVGVGKHWAPERDAIAELIAERVAEDGQ